VSFEFKKKIMENIGEKLEPFSALIVFKDNDNFYIEKKDIQFISNSYHLIGGTPMTKKDLGDIFELISVETEQIRTNCLMPKNIIYYNFKTIIWYSKNSLVNLNFNKKLGIKSFNYKVPTIIFKIEHERLYVYATKTTNINGDTKLYKAPFFNIRQDNSVCLGNVKLDVTGDITYIMNNTERKFYNSEFNLDLGTNILYKNEYNRQYKILKGKSKKEKESLKFNNKILIDSELTINDII